MHTVYMFDPYGYLISLLVRVIGGLEYGKLKIHVFVFVILNLHFEL